MGCGCGKSFTQKTQPGVSVASLQQRTITPSRVVTAQSMPSSAPINKPVVRPQV